MKYIGSENFDHDQPARVGLLVTNLGTPQQPTRKALRTYLKQFLADPRVVEVPRLLWWFILNGIILNVRPARSAKAYASVWTEQGSPLMVHTQEQATKLRRSMEALYGEDIVVDFAMRYGSPSIDSVLQSMMERGVRKLLVLPLYPQYSGPTTGSTFDAIAADFSQRRWLPQLRFVSHYCDHPGYIAALAASIQAFRAEHGEAEKLVFSYHGEPMRYLQEGDPYHCQCLKTTRLVAEILGLSDDDYMTCFQSRFGREEWLKPYTDETLKELAAQGVRSVQVICPGFSADCLETIEEIGIENRDYFISAGGDSFHYIPCLNDNREHIEALTQLAVENLRGWLERAS